MKARLLFPERDVAWSAALPWSEASLRQDLALDTLFAAMAAGDKTILDTAAKIVLAGVAGDLETVLFRQAILHDCSRNPALVRELYALATEAAEKVRPHYLGVLARYPHWVLTDGIDELTMFMDYLRRLKAFAEKNSRFFVADGWQAFFAMITHELDAAYLAQVSRTLETLRPRRSLRLSGELDPSARPAHYRLHRAADTKARRWWIELREWLFPSKAPPNSFTISTRDEAGQKSLERVRDQSIAFTANALGEAKDHVRSFFADLRAELAFYVGCLNLQDRLAAKGEPMCTPTIRLPEVQALAFQGLYDVGLSLALRDRVVGNSADADGKRFIVVTGANQGGKSTFLRSLGLAYLMMQSGMFVPAEAFDASLTQGLFTHYKREEDASMDSGKFDEELKRMSAIVDHLMPHALMLFNESFAATNEREGSEVARQITGALIRGTVRLVCVTHLFDFAQRLYTEHSGEGLFLRANRHENGNRAFRLTEGKPLRTPKKPEKT